MKNVLFLALSGRAILIAATLIVSVSPASGELHTWTSVEGKTVKAYFFELLDDHVVIVTPNASSYRVPLRKLDDEDRRYARRAALEKEQAALHYNQGLAIMDAARTKAIDLFERGAKLHCAHCWMQLGTMRAADGQLRQAQRDLRKAIQISRVFRKCSKDHQFTSVAAHNNLALLLLKEGNVSAAAATLAKAGGILDETPQGVFHNMMLLSEMADGDKAYQKAISAMVSAIPPPTTIQVPQLNRGWFFLFGNRVGAREDDKKDQAPVLPESSDDKYDAYSTGSGFVIGDALVLTNKHVISEPRLSSPPRIRIFTAEALKSGKPQPKIATIIDTNADLDLGLLRVEGLTEAPLMLAPNVVPLGTDVAILGFPQIQQFGASLMVTRGTIAKLPIEVNDNFYVVDGTANPGNSGGPTIDMKTGAVVGITEGRKADVSSLRDLVFNQGFTLSVPSDEALKWVANAVPGFQPHRQVDTPDDVVNSVAQSVVLMETLVPVSSLPTLRASETEIANRTANAPETWNGYFDTVCMRCQGLKHRKCPNRACARGVIRQQVRDVIPGPEGSPKARSYPVSSVCPVCNGDGRIECPQCDGSGRDRRFNGQ